MSRTEMTFGQLKNIHADLKDVIQQSPGLAFILKTPINTFFDENKFVLGRLYDHSVSLAKTYAFLNADGSPATEEIEGQTHYKFLDDNSKQSYIKAITEFFKTKCFVNL